MSKHSHGSAGNSEGENKNARSQSTGAEENRADTQAGQNPNEGAEAKKDYSSMTPEEKAEFLEEELEMKTGEWEAKLAELNDQYLRKAADFENFRKRVNREKQELTDFANQNLLLDLLPVIDDFERAIKSAETSKDFISFYEGICMIEKRLTTMLESKWGLKRFNSEGEPFDPNRHEALQMERSADVDEPVVKEDYLKGYQLKDKVIRFAQVKVLMPEGEGTRD